jgi:hypothetical protein
MRQSIGTMLLAITLSSCATTSGYEAVLQTWMGDSADHLVSSWGPPQQQYHLESGGSVMQYERSGQIVLPGTTTYQPQTTYTNGTVSATSSTGNYMNGSYGGTSTTYVPHTSDPVVLAQSCVTRFTTDAGGRIINWSWQGNACRSKAPPKAQQAQTPATPPPGYHPCSADQVRKGECT